MLRFTLQITSFGVLDVHESTYLKSTAITSIQIIGIDQKPRMIQDLVEMEHPPHSSAQRSQCTEEQTSSAAARMARNFFAQQPAHVVAARGRIVLEPHAPFWITSCSGMAAKLLRTSWSRLTGRRVRAIAQPSEIAKLEQAAHSSLVAHQRAYLSLATETGHVHVVIQTFESTVGRMQIELLLFPAEQDSCFQGIVLDKMQNQATSSGSNSPDKDLVVSLIDSDDEEIVGLCAHLAFAELVDKLDNSN